MNKGVIQLHRRIPMWIIQSLWLTEFTAYSFSCPRYPATYKTVASVLELLVFELEMTIIC